MPTDTHCPECGASFDSLDELLEHGDREHDVVLRWAECGLAEEAPADTRRLSIGPLTVEWGGLR